MCRFDRQRDWQDPLSACVMSCSQQSDTSLLLCDETLGEDGSQAPLSAGLGTGLGRLAPRDVRQEHHALQRQQRCTRLANNAVKGMCSVPDLGEDHLVKRHKGCSCSPALAGASAVLHTLKCRRPLSCRLLDPTVRWPNPLRAGRPGGRRLHQLSGGPVRPLDGLSRLQQHPNGRMLQGKHGRRRRAGLSCAYVRGCSPPTPTGEICMAASLTIM